MTPSCFLRGNNPRNCARLRSTPRRQFLARLQELAAPTVNEGGDAPNSLRQNKESLKETLQQASITGQGCHRGFLRSQHLPAEFGVFAEMMEEGFFRNMQKGLGEGLQWDDAGFSQWVMWFVAPVPALTLLNLARGVVSAGGQRIPTPVTSPKS